MRRYFYGRCSTLEQSLDRQIDYADELGIPEEDRYLDKITGTATSRPALDNLLEKLVQEQDEEQTLYIMELSRLARSTKQLIALSEIFNDLGVNLVSKHEAIDTTSACGKFYFTVLAAMAELDRNLILERTAEGRRAKIAREGRCGGRVKTSKDKLDTGIELYTKGEMTVKEICDTIGVSRSVLYKELKEQGIERQ